MNEGPDGFALASFPCEPTVTTEMPNLSLPRSVVVKRHSASTVLRKPSASTLLRKPAAAPVPCRYGIMWYKACSKVALRRRFGDKKQVMQFGKGGMSQDDLRLIAKKAAAALSSGSIAESDLKGFVDEIMMSA